MSHRAESVMSTCTFWKCRTQNGKQFPLRVFQLIFGHQTNLVRHLLFKKGKTLAYQIFKRTVLQPMKTKGRDTPASLG